MDVDLTTPLGAPASLLERALGLLDDRAADAADTLQRADDIVRAARGPRQRAARAVAHRVGGLALLDQGRVPQAARRTIRGVHDARAAGDPVVLAGCLTTAAALAFIGGRSDAAFAMIDEAIAAAGAARDGPGAFNASAQRSWMLQRSGRWRDALRGVEALLERTGDEAGDDAGYEPSLSVMRALRAEVMADRANILAELGRYDDALGAFDVAIDEVGRWPGPIEIAEVRRNRAICLTHAGRIPEAMHAFAELAAPLAASPAGRLRHLVGLAELLLDSQLLDEALAVTDEAVAIDRRSVRPDQWAEARLVHARALMQSGGDLAAAVTAARAASRAFAGAGSTGRAAWARALVARGAPAKRRVAALEAAAGDLHRAGLRDEAIATRVDALTTAVATGDHAAADHQYRAVVIARETGPALTRARAWLAEAVWHDFGGRPGEARAAVVAGLDILDDHRASLGGTELRAHASGIGEELAGLGLAMALRSGDALDVLWMSERWRAGVVQRRPVTTEDIAETMAELRQVLIDAGEPDLPVEILTRLEQRRAQLEDQVRQRARRTRGSSGTARRPVRVGALRRTLAGGSLIEIVQHGGSYHAVVVGATTRIVELCPVSVPADRLAEMLFALRRLARRGVSAGAAAAARHGAIDALSEMDVALLGPIGDLLGTGPVVVVPPGPLHAVPWPSLPSLSGRIVTVAPSSTWWAGAGERPADDDGHELTPRVVLAAGPRLGGATEEIARLLKVYPWAIALVGVAADEAGLHLNLDGADLAHVACHSRPRADHPHLSALEMADGPFTVYDFERLAAAPRRMVLSACESGVSAVRPGEELLGFLSALFSLGTRAVLASVVPVPDLATTSFMVDFHRRLVGGCSFPEALAQTRRQLLATSNDPADFVVAHAFVAFATASATFGGRPPQ